MLSAFVDHTGHGIHLSVPARRIVSLVPSQTELLADLGLEDEVVGITRYCVHPTQWLNSKVVVGGTKKFDAARIRAQMPDLVLANKEENHQEGIEELRKDLNVWTSDILNLEDALDMISQIGQMTGKHARAEAVSAEIQNSFRSIRKFRPIRVLYLIWRKPWMAAASQTFISSMLEAAGFVNAAGQRTRYPELSDSEIQKLEPEAIFLSSEPFHFREEHMEEVKRLCPAAQVIKVDGEMFSWYGSRLRLAPAYISSLPLD